MQWIRPQMLLLFILALVVWSGYLFVTLRHRVVWARGIEVRRDKQRVLYWICVGVNVFILACGLVAVFMVITGRGHLS
jgi:hypothetical protein